MKIKKGEEYDYLSNYELNFKSKNKKRCCKDFEQKPCTGRKIKVLLKNKRTTMQVVL